MKCSAKTKFLARKLVESRIACFCIKYSQSLVVVVVVAVQQWTGKFVTFSAVTKNTQGEKNEPSSAAANKLKFKFVIIICKLKIDATCNWMNVRHFRIEQRLRVWKYQISPFSKRKCEAFTCVWGKLAAAALSYELENFILRMSRWLLIDNYLGSRKGRDVCVREMLSILSNLRLCSPTWNDVRQCRRSATFYAAFFVWNPPKRFIMFDDEEHLCFNVSEHLNKMMGEEGVRRVCVHTEWKRNKLKYQNIN